MHARRRAHAHGRMRLQVEAKAKEIDGEQHLNSLAQREMVRRGGGRRGREGGRKGQAGGAWVPWPGREGRQQGGGGGAGRAAGSAAEARPQGGRGGCCRCVGDRVGGAPGRFACMRAGTACAQPWESSRGRGGAQVGRDRGAEPAWSCVLHWPPPPSCSVGHGWQAACVPCLAGRGCCYWQYWCEVLLGGWVGRWEGRGGEGRGKGCGVGLRCCARARRRGGPQPSVLGRQPVCADNTEQWPEAAGLAVLCLMMAWTPLGVRTHSAQTTNNKSIQREASCTQRLHWCSRRHRPSSVCARSNEHLLAPAVAVAVVAVPRCCSRVRSGPAEKGHWQDDRGAR